MNILLLDIIAPGNTSQAYIEAQVYTQIDVQVQLSGT
jgi:hypothetical protein